MTRKEWDKLRLQRILQGKVDFEIINQCQCENCIHYEINHTGDYQAIYTTDPKTPWYVYCSLFQPKILT